MAKGKKQKPVQKPVQKPIKNLGESDHNERKEVLRLANETFSFSGEIDFDEFPRNVGVKGDSRVWGETVIIKPDSHEEYMRLTTMGRKDSDVQRAEQLLKQEQGEVDTQSIENAKEPNLGDFSSIITNTLSTATKVLIEIPREK